MQVEHGLLGVFSSYLAVVQTEFDWRQPTHSFEQHVDTVHHLAFYDYDYHRLQFFDTVGWAAGRASGL